MEEEQKSKAPLYIFLVLLLAVGGGFLYWYFLQGPNTPGPGDGSTNGTLSGSIPGTSSASTGITPVPTTTPMGDMIYIKALTGESVPVKDFSKTAIKVIEDTTILTDGSDYSLVFFGEDQGFLITIINSDVQAARDKAESDFLARLGISKEQACILRVSLSIPTSINETLSGQDYHLSFCPNGKPFFRF